MLAEHPHRRLNLLTREWVLVSPHRTQRPWRGQVEPTPAPPAASYDPECYLCPGNERAGGARNPQYESTFVFENDFAALRADTPPGSVECEGLLQAASERGSCRVLCFSPDHGLTLSRMGLPAIRQVVDAWTEQFLELGAGEWIRSVQIFENRGEMMGASNPHPHCQIWASQSEPNELVKESRSQRAYAEERAGCLLCDYLALERKLDERLVCANDSFVALAPFWAVWPFETLILSGRHLSGLDEMTDQERQGLAEILKRLTTRYDNLFEVPFPYTMGFHQRPTDGQPHPCFHFHAHFYPPLLRSATVRKFMVGFEMLATPQRDLTPESAAERLRTVSETHYLEG
jgi:UDPglucose--hexose-1-phosphate uridylyltransferase